MTAAAPERGARGTEDRGPDLDAGLEKELAEIVERAERNSEPEASQAAPWFYRVPFPGVRYYSHRE